LKLGYGNPHLPDILDNASQSMRGRFIVVPNPMYGDWESAVYENGFTRSANVPGEKVWKVPQSSRTLHFLCGNVASWARKQGSRVDVGNFTNFLFVPFVHLGG